MTDVEPTAGATDRKSPLWKKLLLSVASLVALLLVLEGGLRIAGAKPKSATVLSRFFAYHESYGWHGIPGASFRFATVDFDVPISHDEDGLRRCGLGSRVDADADFPGTMVWVLGDSTTWGWGVADGETFVDILNDLSPDDLAFRNLGMPGFAPPQQYFLLKDYFERGRRPDLVLILYASNDLGEMLGTHGMRPLFEVVGGRVELRNHPVPRTSKWNVSARLRAGSLVYNYIHYYLTILKLKLRAGKREEKTRESGQLALREPPPTPEQRIALREGYRMIRQLCAEHGVRFGVIAETPRNAHHLAIVCPELGIPVLDVSRAWVRHLEDESAPPLCFRTDPHANAAGHRLIAEQVYPQARALVAR